MSKAISESLFVEKSKHVKRCIFSLLRTMFLLGAIFWKYKPPEAAGDETLAFEDGGLNKNTEVKNLQFFFRPSLAKLGKMNRNQVS